MIEVFGLNDEFTTFSATMPVARKEFFFVLCKQVVRKLGSGSATMT